MKIKSDYYISTCPDCGIQFAMPEKFAQNLRQTHRDFYCPNGHSLHFPAETKEEKLQKLLAQEEERKQYFIRKSQWLEQEKERVERQRNGYKGMLARVKKEHESCNS